MDDERIRIGRIKGGAFKERPRAPLSRDLYLSEKAASEIARRHPDDYLDRISRLKSFFKEAQSFAYDGDGRFLYLAAPKKDGAGETRLYAIKVEVAQSLYVASFGRLNDDWAAKREWKPL